MICPSGNAGRAGKLLKPAGSRLATLRSKEIITMASEDEDRARKAVAHEIGQDLSMLSLEELTARIALLRGEIDRLEAAVAKKRASRDAANSIFKS
jgi:uncharacterized small protein (DUF1192 family)